MDEPLDARVFVESYICSIVFDPVDSSYDEVAYLGKNGLRCLR